ncbi:tyrosine-type recombinase/integrase [Cytobacillus sp. Bac17]|uniref:tyrosine-type recombinase/integrase n=1 Tax=Cytobacillus sp. Bac17 TaxID=2926008 RepID=UPI0021199F69|nr:tyrosine-type recombinase/integrase [Cytobacillus sp. Bac17]
MNSETCRKQFALDNLAWLDLKTVKNYNLAVKQLFEHTGKPIEEISKQDISSWIASLEEKECKPLTIRGKLQGVKMFFKYCLKEGFVSADPASAIRLQPVKETPPSYLTKEEISQLRQLVDARLPVERAIVEVLFATGMRISELLSIKKEDINWSERTISIPQGKRREGRVVLFTQTCESHLKAYLESRTDDSPYVIVNSGHKIGPMNIRFIGALFKAYSKKLGFRVTPNILRYTFAASLAQKGVPIESIQYLLGHKNLQTNILISD